MCLAGPTNLSTMGKCILRVAKVTSAGSATGKTEHNYRICEVPNADPERRHLNREYVNLGEKDIWTLAAERIEGAGIQKVRKDAVRAMEFLITASPDTFKRNNAGVVMDDYRNSGWVKDNIDFLARKYGKNLVAVTLHQDEKTPHIHAVVVPITTDGRLSAKELFNPVTLKKLQTEYAQAMGKHGLERGIEGSRARHRTMKQIYGAQQLTKQEIENDLKPLLPTQEPLTIDRPGAFDLLNLEGWKQQQEAKINAKYNAGLDQARRIAGNAHKIAVANATAAEQVRILQKKLETSERLKQAHFKKAQLLDQVVLAVDDGTIKKDWIQQQAAQVRGKHLPQMEKDLLESLKGLKTMPQLSERLKAKGYELNSGGGASYMRNPKTGVLIDLNKIQINGQSFAVLVNQAIEKNSQQEAQKIRRRGPRL